MACEGRSGCEATEDTGVQVSGLEQLRGLCTERGPAGEWLMSTVLASGNPGAACYHSNPWSALPVTVGGSCTHTATAESETQ